MAKTVIEIKDNSLSVSFENVEVDRQNKILALAIKVFEGIIKLTPEEEIV